MKYSFSRTFLAAAALSASLSATATAADKIRIANSQKGFWDQTLVEFGRVKGIFAKHDLDPEILWTDGGADAQQAVISGSMDIGFGTGILGVISASSKGAPINIISASMTGSSDLFWYVKADSKIKSFDDASGKTVAFSRPGASSHLIAAALVKEADVNAKLVPAGGPAAALTQVMSGQVDIGWSAVPVGLEREASGEIRVIASGNDAPGVKDQTVRVHIVNAAFLKKQRAVVQRFLAAYQETLDWAYTSDEALQMWAEMNRITLDVARKARDRGYPREALQLFPVQGIQQSIKEAVENKRLDAPLSDAEVTKLLGEAVAFQASLKK